MVRYIAGPGHTQQQARVLARRMGCSSPVALRRRGTRLGWIAREGAACAPSPRRAYERWQHGEAVQWPGALVKLLPNYRKLTQQTARYVERLAQGADPADLLARAPYAQRLDGKYDMLASFHNEGDAQEIATVEFDALADGQVAAENIWMKAAWLSFDEQDTSLRLRFSFGIADIDDVSRDLRRQRHAAELAQTLFPECALITKNSALTRKLKRLLDADDLEYLERILYFNAANGGAQFHHDVERGHRGVIFAQLTGRTAWLAASKPALIEEVQRFCAALSDRDWRKLYPAEGDARAMRAALASAVTLARYFDQCDNTPLEHLLNRTPAFAKQLIEGGYAYLLDPGDVLLLPQRDFATCCWHTVFCAGDRTGQALSFALRTR